MDGWVEDANTLFFLGKPWEAVGSRGKPSVKNHGSRGSRQFLKEKFNFNFLQKSRLPRLPWFFTGGFPRLPTASHGFPRKHNVYAH